MVLFSVFLIFPCHFHFLLACHLEQLLFCTLLRVLALVLMYWMRALVFMCLCSKREGYCRGRGRVRRRAGAVLLGGGERWVNSAVGALPLRVILLAPSPCGASLLPSLLKSPLPCTYYASPYPSLSSKVAPPPST